MNEYEVIIIGGGPGGYAAAVSACALGLKTALVEQEYVGGTCVNFGCIPTKALIRYAKHCHEDGDKAPSYEQAAAESMRIARERRDCIQALLEQAGGCLLFDRACLRSANEVELTSIGQVLRGKNIIIATGSSPRLLPNAEYGEHIFTTREALQLRQVPRSVAVIGSGATGIELATVWNRFGAEVTVFELQNSIMGLGDEILSRGAVDYFSSEGMNIKTGVSVERISRAPAGAEVTYRDEAGSHTLTVDKVLVAAGVVPNSQGLGLEELGVALQRGYIQVDDRMQTNVPGLYAIGDVTGKLALAFTASKQGKTAVVSIAGGIPPVINYANIPRCVFSAIESASVGLSEAQAVAQGCSVEICRGDFPSHDGRAISVGNTAYKLVADSSTGKALGITMVGSNAAEKISVPARLITLGAQAEAVIFALSGRR